LIFWGWVWPLAGMWAASELLPRGPNVRIGGHSVRPLNVHEYANSTQIWVTFASPRTRRPLCVGPLGRVLDALFDRAVANDWSTSVCVAPLEMPPFGHPIGLLSQILAIHHSQQKIHSL
jgi:hypothetical protein